MLATIGFRSFNCCYTCFDALEHVRRDGGGKRFRLLILRLGLRNTFAYAPKDISNLFGANRVLKARLPRRLVLLGSIDLFSFL